VTTGVMGQFVFSIPVVISVALILSLAETFFLLPSRLKFTLRKANQRGLSEDRMETGWFGEFQRKFGRLVKILVRWRYAVLAGITLVMLSAVFVAVYLNYFDLFPKERTELYTARFEAVSGTALEKTDLIASSLSDEIEAVLNKAKIPFDTLVSQVGTSQAEPNDPQGKVGNHTGLIRIHVPMKAAETLSTNAAQDTLRTIRPPELPRLVFEAAVGGPPVGSPLNVTFRSQNETALLNIVSVFKDEIGKFGAVKNLADDIDRGPEEYQLELDNDFLRRAGFTTEDVGVAIQSALQGIVVSETSLRSRKVEVRVRLQARDRADSSAIENIRLLTPNDTLVPLKNLAKIERREGPVTRKRFDFQRAVVVSADVDPRQMSALELNVKARTILARLKENYSDVDTRMGGEEQNTQESLLSLFKALALSLLVILLILVLLTDSFGLAFLILSTIPLGLSGVSYVFWIAGRPLSFMALIGVIGLGGVIVNAAIVLVSFLQLARKEQPDRPLVEVIAEVTALRFKAVLVTNITTIVGLVPTAYGFGGKDPLLVPLSLAMGWGLLVGSFLSLVWLPCGYMILQDLRLDSIRRLKVRFLN
jgi:multidrug efflux pump subunit AcrB